MPHNKEIRLVTVELPTSVFDELERAYAAYREALREVAESDPKPAPGAMAWRALNISRRDLAGAYGQCRDRLHVQQSVASTAFSTVSVSLRSAFNMAADHVEKAADDSRLLEIPKASDETGEEAVK